MKQPDFTTFLIACLSAEMGRVITVFDFMWFLIIISSVQRS
jgi:hypothetical protein